MKVLLKISLLVIFSPCLLLMGNTSLAYQQSEVSLRSGAEISYNSYEDNNNSLIIWIPSEYGTSAELVESALDIAFEGFDLWTLDLHRSYMVPPGRSSISQFNTEDIYQLMRMAKQKGYEHIVLTAAGRGAVLALEAGRQWQLNHPTDHRFQGYIFLHPHLISGSVEIGDDARYLPIARSVNKPVYMIFPEYSTKFLRREQIVQQLETGGATVKLTVLKGIAAGFHAQVKDKLTADDLAMRQQIGEEYGQAVAFLQASKQPDSAVPIAKQTTTGKKLQRSMPQLHPYKANPIPPELQLIGLNGASYDLAEYQGKVVLINFWASWCGPCVKEIPSLNRLVTKMQGKNFSLLTVDINESPEAIHGFFKELKIQHDFPVLMDRQGKASKAWKVYAYPSNFLLDKQGRIRYGYRGALEWDREDILKTIESLL